MNISVIGAGYVGLVTAACLAEIGHQVICLDTNEQKVEMLKKGVSPIYEPGLEALLQNNMKSNRLSFTKYYQSACEKAEVIIIAVGTPSNNDGSADLSAIQDVAEKIGSYVLRPGTIVVTKSTVPVGTNRKVKAWLHTHSAITDMFSIASNPEFLREGSAIFDTFNGDRIVIGAENEETSRKLEEMIAPFGIPILKTSIESGNDQILF